MLVILRVPFVFEAPLMFCSAVYDVFTFVIKWQTYNTFFCLHVISIDSIVSSHVTIIYVSFKLSGW